MHVQIIYTAGHPRVASLALTSNSPSEGTPPYSIILYYGMLVKPLDKMYPVGCDDLGAPYQTVGTICIRIRAHLTISWATNDRPYGITVADEFTCGAPGSYPRAPSLALRAIHLGAPYGKYCASDKICTTKSNANDMHPINKNGERKTLTVILHSPFSILNFSRCLETRSANKAHASESSPTKTLPQAPSRRPALRCRSVLRRRQVRR